MSSLCTSATAVPPSRQRGARRRAGDAASPAAPRRRTGPRRGGHSAPPLAGNVNTTPPRRARMCSGRSVATPNVGSSPVAYSSQPTRNMPCRAVGPRRRAPVAGRGLDGASRRRPAAAAPAAAAPPPAHGRTWPRRAWPSTVGGRGTISVPPRRFRWLGCARRGQGRTQTSRHAGGIARERIRSSCSGSVMGRPSPSTKLNPRPRRRRR